MIPAAAAITRLRAIADQRRQLDDEEAQLLDLLAAGIDGDQSVAPRSSTPLLRAGDLCDSSIAEKLTGRSRDTLIRAARKNPEIGWKPQSGGWRFSRHALAKHFLCPAENAEFARIAEAPRLPPGADLEHSFEQQRGGK